MSPLNAKAGRVTYPTGFGDLGMNTRTMSVLLSVQRARNYVLATEALFDSVCFVPSPA